MNLGNDQKAAIIHVALQMVEADGHPSPSEAYRIDAALNKLEVQLENDKREIVALARGIEQPKAYAIIKDFPLESKKRVVGLLQSIMKVDNEVDRKEVERLKEIASLCDLPLPEAE